MKNALYITAHRNGYEPKQCGSTMTVDELIAFLEQFDGDRPIYLSHDRGYTYGSINERDFFENEENDD